MPTEEIQQKKIKNNTPKSRNIYNKYKKQRLKVKQIIPNRC